MTSDADGWRSLPLTSVISVGHGYAFKGEYFSDSPTGDILVTPGNFAIGGGFSWHKPKYYDGPVDDRYVLSPGELIITMTDLSKASDTLGVAALVPRTSGGLRLLHNQRIGRVTVTNPSVGSTNFLYWLLRSETYRRQVVASATGTTVRHTSPTKVGQVTVRLPPLDEQQRIARVLDSLDAKLDSNRRLAGLLEETAAALFNARFVDFVGVEEFVDSEIGSIPVGWRVDKLATLVEHHVRRCKPSTETAALPYVPIDVIQPHSLALREPKPGAEAQSSLTRFDAGDILFGAMRPYFHKVAIAPYAGTTRTTVFVLKPVTPQDWSYVVMLMHQTDTVEFATRTSRGSTIPYAVWDGALGDMQIPVPAPELRKECGVAIEPILRAIQESSFEQRSLAEIRDLLLPRLISGQIRVPDTVDVDEVIGPLVEAAS